MRIGEGTITEILSDNLAKVQVHRDYLYVACSACAGAEHVYVTANNELGAQEGDDVRYEMQDDHLVVSAFICFIVPLIFIIAGGLAGYEAASLIGAVVGALAGLAAGAAAVRLYDRRLGRKIDTKATITEILPADEEE